MAAFDTTTIARLSSTDLALFAKPRIALSVTTKRTVWYALCLLLLLVRNASADKTINMYQNREDNGYPYFGAADFYQASISVRKHVQTYQPAGHYWVTCRFYLGVNNNWTPGFFPDKPVDYDVDSSGMVTYSGTAYQGGYFDGGTSWNWGYPQDHGLAPGHHAIHYKIKICSVWTNADGKEIEDVLSIITKGDQIDVGPPNWDGYNTVNASVQHFTEHLEMEPNKSCPCNCAPGTTNCANSSVDFTVKLGHTNFGEDAGNLSIHSDVPSTFLATPDGLVDRISDPSCQVVRRDYVVRQVLAAQCLVDVQPVNDFKYQINLYHRTSGDPTDGSGLYLCSGTPFKTITVENPDASAIIYNRLLITESGAGAPNIATEYDWDAVAQGWTMITGNGLRRESVSTVIDKTTGDRVKTRSVLNPAGEVVSKRLQRYHTYTEGEQLISETLDPDGAALTTTWTYFDVGDTGPGEYAGNLALKVEPSGGWERYEYNSFGAETKHVTSFLDAPLGSADDQCRVVATTYADGNPAQTIVETLQGIEVKRHYLAGTTDGQVQEIVCQQPGAAWNAPGNLVTTRRYDASGNILREQRPDGTLTINNYATSGDQKTTVTSVGAPSADGATVVDGTTTTTVVDPGGNQLTQTVTDIASGLMVSSATTVQTDAFGHPTRIVYADGSSELTGYGCCGVDSRTDRDGNTVSYTYDAFSRLASETNAGITTLYVYDADGHRLTTARQGTDGSQITLERLTYDLASRQNSRTDALGHITTFNETRDAATGHTVRTTTLPDADHSTQVQTLAQDGSPLSVGGTAAHPLLYAYGADVTAGAWRQEIRVGDQGAASEWTMTYTDAAGRDYKTLSAAGAVAQSFFNTQGQHTRSVDADGVATLYSYNPKGEQDTVAVDMDRNGQIDLAGTDRITRMARAVVNAYGTVVTRTTTSAWTTNGADASAVMAIDELSADGRSSWHTDAGGLVTHSNTSCDGAGTCTTMVTAPDGSYTVGVTQAGRAASQTRYDANAQVLSGTTFDYDPQGRLWHLTDLRDGATTYTYDNADQLRSVSHAGQTTGYDYDALGRKTLQTEPDNGQVQTAYWPTGEVKSVGGVRTYPQGYTYDSQGRLKTLTTTGAAGAEVTTWNYDAQSGQMTFKAYADGKGPSYTYSAAGHLATRTWARGIVTTYGYDNAGQLASVVYSDGTTPAAAYTYDRLGRMATASGGGSARALGYQGNASLLANETSTAGPLAGVSVNAGYDGLLRRTSLQVAQGQTNLLSQSFGFDAASRLASATQGTARAVYGYWANSAANLVDTITFNNNGQPVMTTTKTYDLLDRLTGIASQVNGVSTPMSGYGYGYNAANERVRADVAADGSHWVYGYDGLGQVTNSSRQWSDNSAVGGQQFGYAFDQIGNRTSATVNGRQCAYTSTLLNEYSQRTVPGAVDVLGNAAPEAVITLNGQPTVRQNGGYFSGIVTADNSQVAVEVPVNVTAVKPGEGTGKIGLATQLGNVFLTQTPESFSYDADGNLTEDGHWTYVWDGEERLIMMEALTFLPAAERKKLAFGYDNVGRRIQKQVWTWNATTGVYQISTNTLFAYDGWNLVAELDGTNRDALLRSYIWGLDLSGSVQGATGVGGLLAITDHTQVTSSQSHFACFDGNGNVVALCKSQDGSTSALYEYDSFGEETRITGESIAKDNCVRFSSKYYDPQCGLYYYGHRYYSGLIGRWLSRDPSGEAGGKNLFTFSNNDPVCGIDILGLYSFQFVGSGWNSANKSQVNSDQSKAASAATKALGDLDYYIDKAQKLCDKCAYKKDLIAALANVRVILKNTSQRLSSGQAMPITIISGAPMDGEYFVKENIFGGITSFGMQIDLSSDIPAILFHESTHEAAGTDDGESGLPWLDAHKYNDIVGKGLVPLMNAIKYYLFNKDGTNNCPCGQKNRPSWEQWPYN